MKRLVRMLLVNWYRIEQQSIEIQGHTAVIGPNASGKSSLLDALQAVLVGGHKDWWRPNASAGEKSTRSLRDYCLGVVRDTDNQDLSQEFRPRPQAITYLVLVFRDESDDSATSLGLAMHARLEHASEQIDGRFIAPGLDLTLSDLTDRNAHGDATPKPWVRLREDLRSRVGSQLILERSPEKFQDQVCAVLSDGKRFLDRKRFLRAFRNAITFTPIKNVSDFVRGQILEERVIQVRSLQQALRHYREIRRRTDEARRREQALEAINGTYTKANQAERLRLDWLWAEQEAAFNALEAALEPLRIAIDKRAQELAELEEWLKALNLDWTDADEALEEANKRLAGTDAEQRRDTLKAQRETAATLLEQARGGLDSARRDLGLIHRVLDHGPLLDDELLVTGLQELARHLLPEDELVLDTWPMDAAAIMNCVEQLIPLMVGNLAAQKEKRDRAITRVADLERILTELRGRIQRLEQGGSDLHPSTLQLQALLADHGIHATPLCDRVDVADESWRDALEAFLGGHRESLLVDPEQVRDAIVLYRREGRRLGIHGSRVVNTARTGDWLERRDPGSLAEVIQSADPHAIAYVNRRAGNVLRVRTEAELMQQDRAITADGMLATGGAVTRLHPEEPMLGREARKQALANLKRRFGEESGRYSEAQDTRGKLERLIDELLVPFKARIDGLPDLGVLARQRQDQLAELKRIEVHEQALLNDEGYRQLKAEVEVAKRRRAGIDEARNKVRTSASGLEKTQQNDRSRLADGQGQSEAVATQRRQLANLPGFDPESAGEHLEELQGQLSFEEEDVQSWRSLGQEAQRRAARQTGVMRKRREQAREDLKKYLAQWPSEQPPAVGLDDDHGSMAVWAVHHLGELRETALSQYAQQAKSALDEAETAFRADFVAKLQENLLLLENQRRELNASLRRRPFHGQYYSFIKRPDKELEPVLNWVQSWTPEQAADVGTLFDASDDPAHPHHEGIAQVKALLLEAGETDKARADWGERLADYRSYYHFDVRMTDDQAGEKNAELLSRRLGKGSGGEHQSPFYVAIGAALAGAYRIERDESGAYRGGMGLAVFDEAFSKLDLQNTVSALGFLDELGLQVLLAAPDEKYGQIAEHVDTIINVYRDGGNVYIDTEVIKPAARRVLGADNPVQRP